MRRKQIEDADEDDHVITTGEAQLCEYPPRPRNHPRLGS
jgi:hypothetical protein